MEKCDVFISHRGPDTKLRLVGYLYDHLRKSNIDVRYAFTSSSLCSHLVVSACT